MSWLLNSGVVLASVDRVTRSRAFLRSIEGDSAVFVTKSFYLPVFVTFGEPKFLIMLDREMSVVNFSKTKSRHVLQIPKGIRWLVVAPVSVSAQWNIRVGDRLELTEGGGAFG